MTTLTGELAAGEVVSHRIQYETRGSQNDAQLDWPDRLGPAPARVRAYATRADCVDFDAERPYSTSGPCSVLAAGGWTPSGVAGSVIVTHGRGNPEVLGSPAEYKLWLVADPERSTRYTVAITWFFGPDC